MKDPQIAGASVRFVQDGNTLGTTNEIESLTVKVEFQLPGEDGFFVIQTDGWSIDDGVELSTLINACKRLLGKGDEVQT